MSGRCARSTARPLNFFHHIFWLLRRSMTSRYAWCVPCSLAFFRALSLNICVNTVTRGGLHLDPLGALASFRRALKKSSFSSASTSDPNRSARCLSAGLPLEHAHDRQHCLSTVCADHRLVVCAVDDTSTGIKKWVVLAHVGKTVINFVSTSTMSGTRRCLFHPVDVKSETLYFSSGCP